MLEIVENQQRFPLGKEAMDLLDQRPRVHLSQTKRSADRGQDLSRITQRGEIDEHGAAGERRRQPLAHLNGQPRLADPARSGQGDEVNVRSRQKLRDGRDLLLAAQEGVSASGKCRVC